MTNFPCKIIEADLDANIVTRQMEGNYTVSAGQKYLCDATPVSAEPVDWKAVEGRIAEFVGEYEMVGEDAQGRDGRYTPSERECALISDAINGLLADDELIALLRHAAPVAAQPDQNLTQQTLDDVKAGIPARDAEIEALRNEIETLQAAHAQQPVSGADGLPIELRGISEAIGNGGGFWRSCSGCHESNEGMATGPFSKTFKCHLGVGCSECGGIGAIWDTTDYDAMADFMAAEYQQRTENTEPVGQDQMRDAAQMIEPSGNSGELPELPDIAPTDDWDSALDCIKKYGMACYQAALQNLPQNIPEIIPESAQQDADKVDADPLQGAADWLVKDCGVKYIAELARRLSIGYNRATRLMEAARKEQA